MGRDNPLLSYHSFAKSIPFSSSDTIFKSKGAVASPVGCVSLAVDRSMVMYLVSGAVFSVSVLAAGLVPVFISVSELSSATVFVSDSELLSAVVSVAFLELSSVSVFNSISEVCIAVSVGVSVEIVFFSAPHPDNSMHRMMNGIHFTLSIVLFSFLRGIWNSEGIRKSIPYYKDKKNISHIRTCESIHFHV